MATREENLKKINEQLEGLSDEQLDEIAGGFGTGPVEPFISVPIHIQPVDPIIPHIPSIPDIPESDPTSQKPKKPDFFGPNFGPNIAGPGIIGGPKDDGPNIVGPNIIAKE